MTNVQQCGNMLLCRGKSLFEQVREQLSATPQACTREGNNLSVQVQETELFSCCLGLFCAQLFARVEGQLTQDTGDSTRTIQVHLQLKTELFSGLYSHLYSKIQVGVFAPECSYRFLDVGGTPPRWIQVKQVPPKLKNRSAAVNYSKL